MSSLLQSTDRGLYCEIGDFYVDPWDAVPRAVITHAHADHARWGSEAYLTSDLGAGVLRLRVGDTAVIQSVPYGETTTIGGVRVSLHPAGHILGSSQIRIEYKDEVWVVSGDYKTEYDRASGAFELVRCHTFITESTFGLPIFRWMPQASIFDEINAWWRMNQQRGRTSILYAYALGKSQRVLAGIDSTIGPLAAHGAVLRFLPAYREAGVALPEVLAINDLTRGSIKGAGLIVAPPSANNTPWAKKLEPSSGAFASGWMQIRGSRRRRAVDRGFVLSDHIDWPGLLQTIAATGAERVGVTHGYTEAVVRMLSDKGVDSWVVPTRFGEDEEADTVE